MKKYLLELANHHVWANNIVIGWLRQINDEQWEDVIVSSFSSIRQTTLHLVSAEKAWSDFWTRAAEPIFLSTVFKGTKDELTGIWIETSAKLRNFVEKYPEEQYHQLVNFRKPGGHDGQMEFIQSLFHVITHAAYHRGQVVTMLRQTGFTKLSATDLSAYYMHGQLENKKS